MLLAVPSVSVVKDHVGSVIRTRSNTHQMLDARARANHHPRIEDLDHWGDGEQIDLGRHVQRRIVCLQPRGTCHSSCHSQNASPSMEQRT